MLKQLHFLQRAEVDIGEIVWYISADNPSAAARVREAIQVTSELLASVPEMGGVYGFAEDVLSDIRFVPIKDFNKYILFYRVHGNVLEIIRVLHGARDISTMF